VLRAAQDRVGRGPLAALLILLGLFLSSGNAAAANSDLRAPSARLGSSRHGPSAALVLPGARDSLDDEASGAGDDPSLAPPAPAVVTERLWARPDAGFPSTLRRESPRPATASYRARAPPAS
jgi:hypothetical protein